MSKRRYNSQSAESAPEDLVKHLKAAANDEVLLREIIENSDIVSITAAFAALLSGGTSDAVNDAKHRKKVNAVGRRAGHGLRFCRENSES